MAKVYTYHQSQLSTEYSQLRETQRLLIFRLLNTINQEQELAVAMVISYLMGWGDTYCSHNYSPIYWPVFQREISRGFPGIKSVRCQKRGPVGTGPLDPLSTPE